MTVEIAYNIIKQMELTPKQERELSLLIQGGGIKARPKKKKLLTLAQAKRDFRQRLLNR